MKNKSISQYKYIQYIEIQSNNMTIYYVSTTGNDTNAGTLASPWRTVQKAGNTMVAGDSVYIRQGTYNEVNISPVNSGTAGNYITFMSYPGEVATIMGNGISGWFNISNKNYIKISNLTMANTSVSGSFYGVRTYACCHIIIQNNIISKSGGPGIYMQLCRANNQYIAGNEDVIVDGNELFDTNYYVDSNNIAWEEALDITGSTNFVVRNNIIHITNKEGITLKPEWSDYTHTTLVGTAYGEVYNNTVYGGLTAYTGVGRNGPGIYAGDLEHNINIYNNVVNGRSVGIALSSENAGIIQDMNVFNNILLNTVNGLTMTAWGATSASWVNLNVINNTFYKNTNLGILVDSVPTKTNVIIRNNIFSKNAYQLNVQAPSGVTVDHNLFDGTNITTGSNPVLGDPLFVNPAAGDFHLQSTSPAKDAGVSTGAPVFDFDYNTRPQGTGYDIGAYEYQVCSIPAIALVMT